MILRVDDVVSGIKLRQDPQSSGPAANRTNDGDNDDNGEGAAAAE